MPVYHNQNPLFSVTEISSLVILTPQSINRRIKDYKQANPNQTLGVESKSDKRVTVYSKSEIRSFLEPKYYDVFQANLNQPSEDTQEETPSADFEVMPTSKLSVTSDLPSHLTLNHTSLATVNYDIQDLKETTEYANTQGNTLAANLQSLIKGYTVHKVTELKNEIDAIVATTRANALGESLTDTVKSISQ